MFMTILWSWVGTAQLELQRKEPWKQLGQVFMRSALQKGLLALTIKLSMHWHAKGLPFFMYTVKPQLSELRLSEHSIIQTLCLGPCAYAYVVNKQHLVLSIGAPSTSDWRAWLESVFLPGGNRDNSLLCNYSYRAILTTIFYDVNCKSGIFM